ncbi:YciI family protein [Deinococcus pimensis]|uniref:YciI family protein n=1 Tax=Deinococcus pimensis TaxID=309888 RepID=UPI00048334AF|nr:YciI family protein [Deinococcus pimensis]
MTDASDLLHFVVLLTYRAPLADIDAALPAHRAFLDEAYADGVFLLSGPRAPRTGGVILARARSEHELRVRLTRDPFARANLATYDLVAFTPTRRA